MAVTPSKGDALLKIDDVTAWLNIDQSTLRRIRRRGEIETVKVGGAVRIPASSVRAYIARNTVAERR